MHPVFAALCFSLLAFAAKPGSPRPKELTAKTCPPYFDAYYCSEYKNVGTKADKEWPDVMKSWCTNDCPGPEAELCRKNCEGQMQGERKLVCYRCDMLSKIQEPSAPALPGITGGAAAVPSSKPAGKAAACNGAANCFGETAGVHRAAEGEVRDRRTQYESGAADARDNTASSITGAIKALERLQAEVATKATPEKRADADADARLVSHAEEALLHTPQGSFTPEEAQGAHDPSVRQQLLYAAQSANQAEDFKQESDKARKAEDEFHGLATESDQRAGGLGSAPSAKPVAAAAAKVTPAISVSSLGDDAATQARAATKAAGEMSTVPDTGVGEAEFTAGHGLTAPDALRERLRRDLAVRSKAEALDGAAFATIGMSPGSGHSLSVAGAPAPPPPGSAAELLQDTLRGLRGASFGLGSAGDTEAELRRLTSDQESLPAAESPSLFERVRRAHRACERRSCVFTRGS